MSWKRLHEPEIELEETASNDNLSRGLAQLDALARRQVQQIDNALEKMLQGNYGDCEACGRGISVKRLKVLPWAQLCFRFAEQQETSRPEGYSAKVVSAGNNEQTDEEIRDIVIDELNEDGRVEPDALEIDCEDGVIYLEGVLPSQDRRDTLL